MGPRALTTASSIVRRSAAASMSDPTSSPSRPAAYSYGADSTGLAQIVHLSPTFWLRIPIEDPC
jgi:hypothetical protein